MDTLNAIPSWCPLEDYFLQTRELIEEAIEILHSVNIKPGDNDIKYFIRIVNASICDTLNQALQCLNDGGEK